MEWSGVWLGKREGASGAAHGYWRRTREGIEERWAEEEGALVGGAHPLV